MVPTRDTHPTAIDKGSIGHANRRWSLVVSRVWCKQTGEWGLLADAARAEIAPMVLAWLSGELRLSLTMREATRRQKQVEIFNLQIMEIESCVVETLEKQLGIQGM